MGYRKAGINFVLRGRGDSGSVFLIHGLFMTSHVMLPIARHLRRNGFDCFGYDYPTRIHSVEEHGRVLAENLQTFERERFHVVTHSMGALLLRSAVAHSPRLAERIGRVVMIAPPNKGSDVASFWYDRIWPRRLIVPLEDLRSEADSRIHALPAPDLEIGVLAAEHDGAVRYPYTFLPTEKDRLVLPSSHTLILLRRDAARAVERFLRTGTFRGDSRASGAPVTTPS